MIDFRSNEIAIVEGLKNYLSTDDRPCEVVRQNQTAKVPPYPYVSYTVITPASERGGSYSVADDGTRYRNLTQTWSFTAQSDDMEEALTIALHMFDWFSETGRTPLADKGITVRRVGGITPRDNLISIEYEHRCGLDVTFILLHQIAGTGKDARQTIETNTFKEV